MKHVQGISIIVLIWLVIWLLVKPNHSENLPRLKDVETRIEYHDTIIKQTERVIIEKQVNNLQLENKINDLTLLLDSAKQARDTVLIIQIQDTTIHTLKRSNDTLKSIISLKDTVILNKDYIIGSKDTIIEVKDNDIKKLKRQRLILGGLTAVLVGVAIIK